MLGEGELPISAVFDSLRSVNYEGYLSLELKSEWLSTLGSPDIVLPQFAGYASSFESVPSWQNKLYDNKAGTGKYIWKKESLIERTFSEVLDRVAEEFPDQEAFKYTTLDYTRTYAEFRDEVDVVARAFMAIGVKAGDHVAVWATNIPEWFLSYSGNAIICVILLCIGPCCQIHAQH